LRREVKGVFGNELKIGAVEPSRGVSGQKMGGGRDKVHIVYGKMDGLRIAIPNARKTSYRRGAVKAIAPQKQAQRTAHW